MVVVVERNLVGGAGGAFPAARGVFGAAASATLVLLSQGGRWPPNAMMLATVREGPGAAGLPAPLVRVLEEVGLYFDVVKKETNVKD